MRNNKRSLSRCLLAAVGLWLLSSEIGLAASVEVTDAWARATMPGQAVAGVYLHVKSALKARLVGVKSSSAETAEIHSMAHEGGVMKMRKLDFLDLPAGETVALEPGGNHVMLFDIRKPLKAGEHVKLTLVIEQNGKKINVPVDAEVRALTEEH
jgi:periplasmic copper chaperone A